MIMKLVTCTCGAIYERREVKAMVRDKDSFECYVCNRRIEEWSASRFPVFKLVKRRDGVAI
jgi:hypothetical protein